VEDILTDTVAVLALLQAVVGCHSQTFLYSLDMEKFSPILRQYSSQWQG